MKKVSLFFVYLHIVFGNIIIAQQGIQWLDPIDVSITDSNFSPVVGALNDGNPAIVWGKGSTIYFTKMENGVFIPTVKLSTGSNLPGIYTFGGLDMAIKDNIIFIVYENFNNGVFIIKSSDGGDSFEAPVNVYNPAAGKWATLASVAIDDSGNPLVSVILENTNETQGQYIMMRSLDAGATFKSPVVASESAKGDYVCECCPSDIHTVGDDVWLAFRNNDNNLRDMWVTKSENGGYSFDRGVDIDDTDWVLNYCPISGPKIAPLKGDSLMTIWKSAGNGDVRVYISTLNGTTMEKGYEASLPLSNPNGSQGGSAIAGANDTIGIVWEESGFGANGVDLMFALSTNGSQGLTENLSNITQATSSQKFPSLVYDHGVFHLLHTNGSGLQYRKGIVAAISAIDESDQKTECLELIENPITNHEIRLRSTCNIKPYKFDATLSTINGNVVCTWEGLNFNSMIENNLNIPELPKGFFLLSVNSENGLWVERIAIWE